MSNKVEAEVSGRARQYETSEGHGRRENIPSRGQRKPSHPLLAQCAPLCVADWGTPILCSQGKRGRGHSPWSDTDWGVTVSSLGGGQEAKNILFLIRLPFCTCVSASARQSRAKSCPASHLASWSIGGSAVGKWPGG